MKSLLLLGLIVGLTAAPATPADLRPEEIVTVLPKDAIPAILKPTFGDSKSAAWLSGAHTSAAVLRAKLMVSLLATCGWIRNGKPDTLTGFRLIDIVIVIVFHLQIF